MSDQVHMMTNATHDEKAEAIVEAAARVIAKAKADGAFDSMVDSLVTACLTYAAAEISIRDEASDQVKAVILRDAMIDLAAIMGVRLDLLPLPKALN